MTRSISGDSWRGACAALAILLVALAPALADEEKGGKNGSGDGEEAAQPAPGGPPVYVPPGRGAPQARIGGATRSFSMKPVPRIQALVPDEVAFTLEAQPVLYWYLSMDTTAPAVLAIHAPGADAPVIETQLSGSLKAGVQRISLADHGVTLEKGVAYQWHVSLASDPARLTGGGVERTDPPDRVAASLASGQERPAVVLARAGIWYDAFDALSREIDAAPGNAKLRSERADLLRQVGLDDVADAEDGTPSP